jgi:type IV pilus assembly protein PilA
MKKNQYNQGFTIIELLVTIAIIGILAAIAIPQYSRYRRSGFDVMAKEDIANVARAEEAYFVDTSKYLDCTDAGCNALPGVTDLSAGVTLGMAATATGFTGTSTHPKGSGIIYTWDSGSGGLR